METSEMKRLLIKCKNSNDESSCIEIIYEYMEQLTDTGFDYLVFQYQEYFEQSFENKEISEHYFMCKERSDFMEFIGGHTPIIEDFFGLVWFFINYVQELEEDYD